MYSCWLIYTTKLDIQKLHSLPVENFFITQRNTLNWILWILINFLEKNYCKKDLGVLISNNLKPSWQCQKAANPAMAVLNQILRAFIYRDRITYINLYKTYVRPHLEFSSPVWNPWVTSDVKRLENVQKKALKQEYKEL